ncbi:MAG: hypothetical protein ACRDGH_10425, partial [Candidatus Limnocylindria bacterium]
PPSGQSVQVEDRGPFEPEAAHWYTAQDRVEQLRQFASACEHLADLFAERHLSDAAAYRAASATATELLPGPVDLERVKALDLIVPPAPGWLHPKALDFNAPRDAWQAEVARSRQVLDGLVIALRSLATYDRP